jgi:hypothetical protein
MYIQSYLYNPKIYHIEGSDNKYSGNDKEEEFPLASQTKTSQFTIP